MVVGEERTYEFTTKRDDFSEWYTQIVEAAGIVDKRYDFKGAFVWLGYGYRIMQNIKRRWDQLFQDAGLEELYFPLIVPIAYCEQNESWWEGFKSEGYRVIAGENSEVQGALRPTGEPAMYPMFSLWTRTKADLPIRIYETVSSFRYETKHTRPLIRDREITVWHEIHTAHATKEEAQDEMNLHMVLWDKLWGDLAMPLFKVEKPIWECFPGAVGAVEYYNVMPDGKVMENGSCNNLGQAYSKKFNIKFKNESGEDEYAWQICTGNGARYLAAAIGVHGDDKGLVLPPRIAPIQVIIVPIIFDATRDLVTKKCHGICDTLKAAGIAVEFDSREITPGRKFYDWEIKGVPIRLEVGPKDLEKNQCVLVRRDTNKKLIAADGDVISSVKTMLDDIHDNLLSKATDMLKSKISFATTMEDITNIVNSGKIAEAFWCGSGDCYDKVSGLGEGFEGFGSNLEHTKRGECVMCGKDTDTRLFVAKSY